MFWRGRLRIDERAHSRVDAVSAYQHVARRAAVIREPSTNFSRALLDTDQPLAVFEVNAFCLGLGLQQAAELRTTHGPVWRQPLQSRELADLFTAAIRHDHRANRLTPSLNRVIGADNTQCRKTVGCNRE